MGHPAGPTEVEVPASRDALAARIPFPTAPLAALLLMLYPDTRPPNPAPSPTAGTVEGPPADASVGVRWDYLVAPVPLPKAPPRLLVSHGCGQCLSRLVIQLSRATDE